jgi:hypothetical protein
MPSCRQSGKPLKSAFLGIFSTTCSQIVLFSNNIGRHQGVLFSRIQIMIEKALRIWLLIFGLGIAGCEQAQPADPPAAAGKEPTVTTAQEQPERPSLVKLGKETVPSVSRTPDMTPYHWPADFKLPLVINIEASEAPKEIQGPSQPIEEEKKAIGDEKK